MKQCALMITNIGRQLFTTEDKTVMEGKEKIREEDLLNVSGGHKIGSFKKKKKTEVSDEPYNPFDHLKEIFSGSDDSEEGGATGGW